MSALRWTASPLRFWTCLRGSCYEADGDIKPRAASSVHHPQMKALEDKEQIEQPIADEIEISQNSVTAKLRGDNFSENWERRGSSDLHEESDAQGLPVNLPGEEAEGQDPLVRIHNPQSPKDVGVGPHSPLGMFCTSNNSQNITDGCTSSMSFTFTSDTQANSSSSLPQSQLSPAPRSPLSTPEPPATSGAHMFLVAPKSPHSGDAKRHRLALSSSDSLSDNLLKFSELPKNERIHVADASAAHPEGLRRYSSSPTNGTVPYFKPKRSRLSGIQAASELLQYALIKDTMMQQHRFPSNAQERQPATRPTTVLNKKTISIYAQSLNRQTQQRLASNRQVSQSRVKPSSDLYKALSAYAQQGSLFSSLSSPPKAVGAVSYRARISHQAEEQGKAEPNRELHQALAYINLLKQSRKNAENLSLGANSVVGPTRPTSSLARQVIPSPGCQQL